MQSACSPKCAQTLASIVRQRKEKADTKVRREALKTKSDYVADVQKVFNLFIRLRDCYVGYPCVSCGKPLDYAPNTVDAGHYRSRGSAPHLRFHEDNCHSQCKQCNQFASGNAVNYRIGLINRIGLERVEAVERDNAARKWNKEELITMLGHYRNRVKQMKKMIAERK